MDCEKELSSFLSKYENAKATDYTEDGNTLLKDKFKLLWDDYISNNVFSHQSKLFLIRGGKFKSADLLWKYISEKYPSVVEANNDIRDEFKDVKKDLKLTIPSELSELFVFLQELKNQQKEISKREQKIRSLENEFLVLKNDIRNLENELFERQKEIEQLRNDIIEEQRLKSVQIKDEGQKVIETYKKIANELNYAHSTFLEAENMEMNSDLGEVLRDQLKEIFETLSKHGIVFGD